MRRLVMLAARNIDAQHWRREVLDARLISGERKPVDYFGDALVSLPAGGHGIDFSFDNSLFAKTTVHFPLYVSAHAVARLSVNGGPSGTYDIQASVDGVPLLHDLSANVFEWSGEGRTSIVRLRISHGRDQGSATILNNPEEEEYSPRALQDRTFLSVARPTLFFSLAWGSVLAWAIVLVANVHILDDTLRFYATLTVVGGWIASVLGLPGLAKIPLRSVVRRAYASTQDRLLAAGALLIGLFCVGAVGAVRVLSALTLRYVYTSLIRTSLSQGTAADPAGVARAFAMLPGRREAQILFERHAYTLRTQPGVLAMHAYVKNFVANPAVKAAVEAAASATQMPSALKDSPDPQWFYDPIVWYASVLPEAEDSSDTTLTRYAVQLLELRAPPETHPEAYLLRQSLELRLQQDDREAVRRIQKELTAFVGTTREASYFGTFEYELACDRLAASYVRACKPYEATYWFQNELNARRQRNSNSGDTIFHRPAHKLLLYHLFMSYSHVEESGEDVAARILDDVPRGSVNCQPYRQTFVANVLNDPRYVAYKDRGAWLQQTIVDTSLESLLNASLAMGWRY